MNSTLRGVESDTQGRGETWKSQSDSGMTHRERSIELQEFGVWGMIWTKDSIMLEPVERYAISGVRSRSRVQCDCITGNSYVSPRLEAMTLCLDRPKPTSRILALSTP